MHNNTPQTNDGLSMAGKIRTKEKCPKCAKPFIGEPLTCPSCLTSPKHYYIFIYARGFGKLKIYSDKTGHPLDSFERARRVLESLRYEIDQRSFDPTYYSKKTQREFLFEHRMGAWLDDKEREAVQGIRAPSYVKKLVQYGRLYFLPHFKGRDVRDIKTHHIKTFRAGLKTGLSRKYIRNIIDALHNFFRSLRHDEVIREAPNFTAVVKDIKLGRKVRPHLDIESQGLWLKEIPEGDAPIFLFLAFQGKRIGEARGMKVKDFDFRAGTFRVCRNFPGESTVLHEYTKSGREEVTAIIPLLLGMLVEQCRDKHPEAFVFTNPRTGGPYCYSTIHRLWRKARDAANKAYAEEHKTTAKLIPDDMTPKDATRHSFATSLRKKGVGLDILRDLLNHSDIRITSEVYAHVDAEDQSRALEIHTRAANDALGNNPLSALLVPRKKKS